MEKLKSKRKELRMKGIDLTYLLKIWNHRKRRELSSVEEECMLKEKMWTILMKGIKCSMKKQKGISLNMQQKLKETQREELLFDNKYI